MSQRKAQQGNNSTYLPQNYFHSFSKLFNQILMYMSWYLWYFKRQDLRKCGVLTPTSTFLFTRGKKSTHTPVVFLCVCVWRRGAEIGTLLGQSWRNTQWCCGIEGRNKIEPNYRAWAKTSVARDLQNRSGGQQICVECLLCPQYSARFWGTNQRSGWKGGLWTT